MAFRFLTATDEGGYGGDPFSRENQAPQQKGQFSQDRSADRSAPYQQQDSTKEEDDQDRYAGEGIIPRKSERLNRTPFCYLAA